jgi:hypothetical protein
MTTLANNPIRTKFAKCRRIQGTVAGSSVGSATETRAPDGEHVTRRCKIDTDYGAFYFDLAWLSEAVGPDLNLSRNESAYPVI